MTCGVYCLITKESGLRYIGSSLCIEVRIKTHFNLLKRGTHYNYKIQAAYNTEGALFCWGKEEIRVKGGERSNKASTKSSRG